MQPRARITFLALSVVLLPSCKRPDPIGPEAASSQMYVMKKDEKPFLREFPQYVACQLIKPDVKWEELEAKVKASDARHAAFLEFRSLYQAGDEVLSWTDQKGFIQSKAPESLVHLYPDDPYGHQWTPLSAKYRSKEPTYASVPPAGTVLTFRKIPRGVCLMRNHEVVAILILGVHESSR